MPIRTEEISINFIPFKTIYGYITDGKLPTSVIVSNLVGNLLLTLPFGVYLALKNMHMKKISLFAYSLIFPFVIELGQLFLHFLGFTTRTVDIDDLILNCLGILFGFVSFKLLNRLIDFKVFQVLNAKKPAE